LHHYFEIFQDGHRYYPPLHSAEIVTGAVSQALAHDQGRD
jgi:hypothetical protein